MLLDGSRLSKRVMSQHQVSLGCRVSCDDVVTQFSHYENWTQTQIQFWRLSV